MFWYGILGFVAMFIHGLNAVKKVNDRMGSLKMVGGGLVGLSLLEFIPSAEKELIPGGAIGFGILAGIFAVLLLYTNVVAGDPGSWKRAAKQEKGPVKEQVVDTGLYGLCRHPGVWWMTGLCLCLYMSGGMPWMNTIVYIALYFAVTWYNDSEIYPELIPGYENYKKRVNFLLPTFKKKGSKPAANTAKGKKK